MQPTLTAWLNHFTAVRSDAKTAATPHEHQGYFMNAADWCKSHRLLLAHMEATSVVTERRHYARQVLRKLTPELAALDPDLAERIRDIAGDTTHGNADRKSYTLWHINGARVSGNRRELLAATGLHMDRLKDLLGGRRRLVKGWTMTEGEARRGRLPPGPKKKAPEPCVKLQDIFEDDMGARLF